MMKWQSYHKIFHKKRPGYVSRAFFVENPDEVTIDDIVECLMLIQIFDEGRKNYEAGHFVTHDEVGKRLEKSFGL
jgi:hypothetical protein